MGKRFGRNQKRRLREQIAFLEADRADLCAANEVVRAKLSVSEAQLERLRRDMQEWGQRIVRTLGPSSAFNLRIAERALPYPLDHGMAVQVDAGGYRLGPGAIYGGAAPALVGAGEVVNAFSVWCRTHADELRGRVIVDLVSGRSGRHAYAMDMLTFSRNGITGPVLRRLGVDIAEQLAAACNHELDVEAKRAPARREEAYFEGPSWRP